MRRLVTLLFIAAVLLTACGSSINQQSTGEWQYSFADSTGAYSDKLEDLTTVDEHTADGVPKSNVEILIERIQKIQTELPAHDAMSEEEAAFLEGAEQHFAAIGARHHRR